MKDLTYIERARFLVAVRDMGEGNEIPEACFQLTVESESEVTAPWAQSDPFAAERYLAARGATPKAAAANAAEFEISMRALYALATGERAQSFQDLADWIDKTVDGAP
ncbi:hypothetical protein ACFU6S_03645 [Streptomyces sp. NPDC057456]|uniref:hypothetical protein n=1 Tax=Streptomyces sp. NPDC057456 TaxID=3346139 RepID=UPI0036CF41AD